MPPIAPDAPLSDAEIAEAEQHTSTQAHTVISPAPEPIEWPTSRGDGKPFKLSLPPPKIWLYRNPDGSLYGAVGRWDRENGKIPLPCVYASMPDSPAAWRWAGFGPNRPPLYAEQIAAAPNAPVLIVFGEKTCDAARKYVPDGWVVTTFQGGDNAVHYTDWTVLRGHSCVIWPDLDADRQDKTGKPILPSGEQCGFALTKILHGLGIAVETVPVYGPRFAKGGFPRNGWDLADDLPGAITASAITGWITRTLQAATLPAAEPAPLAIGSNVVVLNPPTKPVSSDVDSDLKFQALGFGGDPRRYFFLSTASQCVHSFTGPSMIKDASMLEIVPDHLYWGKQYGADGNGVPWKRIGAELMAACYAVGMYSPENCRGRGAWIDGKRTVFHAGDHLLVDGDRVRPSHFQSRFIYPREPNFFDDIAGVEPLSDDEAKQLLAICRMMPWEGGNKLLGDLAAGLIATAVIGGALRWRSHGWISGQSGSGKTWFINHLVGRAMGNLAIYPLGESTEAGIRQFLQSDARPVVFDEFEGKGLLGAARRDAVISLMRSSASDGRGTIIKGSSGHDAQSFQIRCTFLVASIDVGLREAADETRCLVLTLANQQGYTAEQQKASAERFARIQALTLALPADLPARLLARLIRLIPAIRANAEIFSTALAGRLSRSGTRRVGDLLGTPMAGAWALNSSSILSPEDAETYLGKYDWSPFLRTKETKEDIEVLRFLLQQEVRIPLARSSTTVARPLGEIMSIVALPTADDQGLDIRECDRLLTSIGIRYTGADQSPNPTSAGFWFASHHDALDRLLARSDYSRGYIRILGRATGSIESNKLPRKSVRFGAIKTTAIWLPIDVVLPSDDAPDGD